MRKECHIFFNIMFVTTSTHLTVSLMYFIDIVIAISNADQEIKVDGVGATVLETTGRKADWARIQVLWRKTCMVLRPV